MGGTVRSMFAVRTPSWHREETLLQDYPGREQAMKLAGHDWKAVEMPVLVQGRTENRAAEGWKAIVRRDTGAILSVVRSSYQIVQNDILWDLVDALVQQPRVKYDTAGVLADGATLWVNAVLDEPIRIPGDDSDTLPYIVGSTTHDGSGSVTAKSTMVRTVCVNTHQMAEAEARKRGTLFTFRHTRNVLDRIEEARKVIRGAKVAAEAYRDLACELGQLPITPAQHGLFLEQFIPLPPVAPGTLVSERVVSNVEAARLQVEKLFDGPTIPDAHRATGYGLFLAATEYLDHLRAYRSQDTYFTRCMLRTEPAKAGLAALIREVAAN